MCVIVCAARTAVQLASREDIISSLVLSGLAKLAPGTGDFSFPLSRSLIQNTLYQSCQLLDSTDEPFVAAASGRRDCQHPTSESAVSESKSLSDSADAQFCSASPLISGMPGTDPETRPLQRRSLEHSREDAIALLLRAAALRRRAPSLRPRACLAAQPPPHVKHLSSSRHRTAARHSAANWRQHPCCLCCWLQYCLYSHL